MAAITVVVGGVGQGEEGGEWERNGDACEGADELRYCDAGDEKAEVGDEKEDDDKDDGEDEEYGGEDGGVEEGDEGGDSC